MKVPFEEKSHPLREEGEVTYTGQQVNLYKTATQSPTLYLSAKASQAQFPDMPPRSDTQALRLIVSIPLIQWRKKCPSHKEKVPSRSGILLSMYVVLKTRYVNPNIQAHRY